MKIFACIFFLVSLRIFAMADVPITLRENYTKRLHNAFLIQSIGETRMAYRVFKGAYQDALKAGESIRKLQVMDELFRWYRKYGWYCGIMAAPAKCLGEMKGEDYSCGYSRENSSHRGTNEISPLNGQIDYQAEWEKNPRRARHVRSYIIGVSEIIGGLFVVRLPFPGSTGVGFYLMGNGFLRIINLFNDSYSDREEFIHALKAIEAKATATMKE